MIFGAVHSLERGREHTRAETRITLHIAANDTASAPGLHIEQSSLARNENLQNFITVFYHRDSSRGARPMLMFFLVVVIVTYIVPSVSGNADSILTSLSSLAVLVTNICTAFPSKSGKSSKTAELRVLPCGCTTGEYGYILCKERAPTSPAPS